MASSKIIVTGAAGFIGSYLANTLRSQGHTVLAVDAKQHFVERPEIQALSFESVMDRADFLAQSSDLLSDRSNKVEAVFHLGACTDTTQMDVGYLNQVNLEYSKKIWSLCAQNQIPLIYASSAATYGNGEHGYDDHPQIISRLKPLNPYGQSKQDFDLWVQEQIRSGHTPPHWAGFKFFNVYGPHESHKKRMASMVYQAFHQIREKGSVRLFKSHRAGIADGHQKRDFVFVGDVVQVLLATWKRTLHTSGIYNLGTGQARTFEDLVLATFHAMGRTPQIEFVETPKDLREQYQYFTEAKLERLRAAGYSAAFTSLERGVEQYVRHLTKSM